MYKTDLGYKQLSFGYDAKMKGYANFIYTVNSDYMRSTADIPKLGDMHKRRKDDVV